MTNGAVSITLGGIRDLRATMNEKGSLMKIAGESESEERQYETIAAGSPRIDPGLNTVVTNHRGRRTATIVGSFLTALAIAAALLIAAPLSAQAVTTRPGAQWGQIDMLLDSYETEAARRDWWSAAVICWDSGLATKLAIAPCVAMVTVCAAQAYYSSPRRRAGITYTPWGQAWCWKY
jgi:hypothetical protein